MEVASIIIAVSAVIISAITMWLTLIHRGQLKMTRPSVVFFGYDFDPTPSPKIFLRTLLFSTSNQGRVIETMYIRIINRQENEIFSFWGYEDTGRLVPGSGLYVGRAGVSSNHHFVKARHKSDYCFLEGSYRLEVFANIVGKRASARLYGIDLVLTTDHAAALAKHEGVLFELKPDSQVYVGALRGAPNSL